MKNHVVSSLFGALAFVSFPVIASAADTVATASDAAPAFKTGESIRTADGKQLGRIDYILSDRAGKPVSARVIYNGRFVTVPVSSIARADKGVTTSLTLAAIRSAK